MRVPGVHGISNPFLLAIVARIVAGRVSHHPQLFDALGFVGKRAALAGAVAVHEHLDGKFDVLLLSLQDDTLSRAESSNVDKRLWRRQDRGVTRGLAADKQTRLPIALVFLRAYAGTSSSPVPVKGRLEFVRVERCASDDSRGAMLRSRSPDRKGSESLARSAAIVAALIYSEAKISAWLRGFGLKQSKSGL